MWNMGVHSQGEMTPHPVRSLGSFQARAITASAVAEESYHSADYVVENPVAPTRVSKHPSLLLFGRLPAFPVFGRRASRSIVLSGTPATGCSSWIMTTARRAAGVREKKRDRQSVLLRMRTRIPAPVSVRPRRMPDKRYPRKTREDDQ